MKHKKLLLTIAALFALCINLTGCKNSHFIENQAYAIMAGVDREDDGSYTFTIRIPKFGEAQGSGGGGGGQGKQQSEYLTYKAKGTSLSDAMTIMGMGVPRDLTYSEMSLIVISEDIAFSREMPDIVRLLTGTYKMYTSANIAICQGDAGDFVEKQEAAIGSDLSVGITSRLQNASEIGYTPKSRLVDLFFDTSSVYSDPMVTMCTMSENDGDAMEPDMTSIQGLSVEAESKNRYMGAVVMKNGIAAGKLTGEQTVFANVLSGDVDALTYTFDGIRVQLIAQGKPRVQIDTSDGKVKVDVHMSFTAMGTPETPDPKGLGMDLRDRLYDTVKLCQSMKTEPFGFARIAARSFFTLDEWMAFGWANSFSEAEVNIGINIQPVGY